MYRQSISTRPEDDQDALPIGPAERDILTIQSVDNQISPVGFSLSPTIFHQQYNLTTSFGSCTHTSSIDMTQAWAIPQQQYTDLQSQSLVQQGLSRPVPRLSVAKSLGSDEGDDTSEPTSPQDNASERRKERRRAQNRVAQRAFRARKEDTIKESSARLEALQEELIRLECANGNLSATVSRLSIEIARLREENAALGGREANGIRVWEGAADDEDYSKEIIGTVGPNLDEHEARVPSFGLDGGVIGTIQWQDAKGPKRERDEEKDAAEAVMDAAAALSRNMF